MSDLKLYTRAALTPGVSDLFYLTRADGSADGTASFQTAAPVFAGVLAPFYAPLAHGHAAGVITGLAAVATSGDYADLTGRPTLGSLAALNAVNNGNWSGAALAIGNGGTGATNAAGARTALGLAIGSDVQAFDADLSALAALSGTNTLYYRSGASTWTGVTIGSGLSFTGGTLATTGGGFSGAYGDLTSIPAALDAIDGLTPAADKVAYYSGASTAALATLTAYARTLLAGADPSALRTLLGLIIDTDVPSKSYVDGLVQGLSWKKAVRAATTASGTLASAFENGDTVDGVTLATGDRILIKNQSSGAENGIYVVAASGAPSRASDADAGAELVNATVYVSEGTANADTQWTCTTNATITPGSTSLAFAQLATGGGALQASNNLSEVGNAVTAGSNIRPVESLIIACGDEATAITTGTAKVTFRMPYAFTATAVRASVTTAPTGSTIIVDINEAGTTILSTKLSIDASEKTSTTAASAAVISDTSLADDAEITIDFDQVGSMIAGAGVKVTLIGNRT